MKKSNSILKDTATLRQKAEKELENKHLKSNLNISEVEKLKLLHE